MLVRMGLLHLLPKWAVHSHETYVPRILALFLAISTDPDVHTIMMTALDLPRVRKLILLLASVTLQHPNMKARFFLDVTHPVTLPRR